MQPSLANASRAVVKIGSALLADPETGALNEAWLDGLARDVAQLRKRGKDVLIVSSGAIAIGRRHLGLAQGALKLEEMQAAAACGQIRLAHAYQSALARHGIGVAQILLTHEDTEARRRYLNARSTINTLLSLGTVPVINENDTVATNEIRFGDNDRLAARVAVMMSADLLVLLSDVDGLYESDPRHDADARWIPTVERITPQIEAMAGDIGTPSAAGGMVTKIAAAKHAMAAGCHMVIAEGAVERPSHRAGRWRPFDLVCLHRDAARGPQELDRERAGAARHPRDRRRRLARAAPGPEPAAGRREGGGRHVRARRRGGDQGRAGARGRPRPGGLFRRRCKPDRRPQIP